MQVLQAFTDELSFELARILYADQPSGVHGRLEMTSRHEIVVRILWRERHGIALGGLMHI